MWKAHHAFDGQVTPEAEGVPGGSSIAPVVEQACAVPMHVHLHVLCPGQFGDISLHQVGLEVIQHHDSQSWSGCEGQQLVHYSQVTQCSVCRQSTNEISRLFNRDGSARQGSILF